MSEIDPLRFWRKNPNRNLWQHPLWQGFQQALGRKTWILKTEHSSALVVRHPLPFGLCWLEIPRGPLVEKGKSIDRLMEEVVAVAKAERAIFVRMSPCEDPKLAAYRLSSTALDHHPETTLVLDLSLSEEDLLRQMKPKGRYNIKVAVKNNVTVREYQGVDAFYELLRKTTGRDGFSSHPKAYYQKMLQALGPNAQLLMAGKEGKAIAGGIFVYLDNVGTYYYGASDHEYRNWMAPYLLQWEAIKEAKRRGCKAYDFLGIAPEHVASERPGRAGKNHPWAGVTEFKRKFGGTVVNYPQAKEVVISPFWCLAYRIYKRVRG